MFLSGKDEEGREGDRVSGRFKGHLKRGMEVRWMEDRRARGEPASPVSPTMNI